MVETIKFNFALSFYRCDCSKCDQTARKPKLSFSATILNFGILPTGLDIEKDFFIESLTEERAEWFIIELRYNIDTSPHAVMLDRPNVNHCSGCLCFKGQRRFLFYTISGKVRISF